MKFGARPPVVILPLPSIEQMLIRTVLARQDPPRLMQPLRMEPVRGVLRKLLSVVPVMKRFMKELLPRPLLLLRDLEPRGPPVN